MKRLLEKFKQEKKVVSIYNDSADTGNCWNGRRTPRFHG